MGFLLSVRVVELLACALKFLVQCHRGVAKCADVPCVVHVLVLVPPDADVMGAVHWTVELAALPCRAKCERANAERVLRGADVLRVLPCRWQQRFPLRGHPVAAMLAVP